MNQQHADRFRMQPTKICPWCEGRKVTGRMAYGEEPDSVTVLAIKVPIIGTMMAVSCNYCEGKGEVPRDLDQVTRFKQLADAREARKRRREGDAT